MKKLPLLLTLIFLISVGCTKEDLYSLLHGQDDHKKPIVQRAELEVYQPAGDLGGPDNLLEPGTWFPPTDGGYAILRRGHDYIQYNLHTTGLPPGAYTVWYFIFNDPSSCSGECDNEDLFLPMSAGIWSTGKVIGESGVGNFSDKLYVGEQRDEAPLVGDALDSPLENPQGAVVYLVLKYHGLASDDPDIFYEQIHTLLGNCGPDGGANSHDLGPPFGIQCFDPQEVIFPAPGEAPTGH